MVRYLEPLCVRECINFDTRSATPKNKERIIYYRTTGGMITMAQYIDQIGGYIADAPN